jgi:hypothetical protein
MNKGWRPMRKNTHDAPITGKRPVIRLVRDDDEFEAVIVPTRATDAGTHELRYLWNRRPFISRVFQRGNLEGLLASVRQLTDELIERGWLLVVDAGLPALGARSH